jgi:hypothetical protein
VSKAGVAATAPSEEDLAALYARMERFCEVIRAATQGAGVQPDQLPEISRGVREMSE